MERPTAHSETGQPVWPRRQILLGASLLMIEASLIIGDATNYIDITGMAEPVVHGSLLIGGIGSIAAGAASLHRARTK